ncbi:MAG: LuxR C-terminal-related transcriptional regulator [Puia sp.]|nr:LuxR C-terminal-related transcriptional regulator [Puia sp.]
MKRSQRLLEIAKTIWEQNSPKYVPTSQQTDDYTFGLSRRLAYFFQPGDFYYYIFDVSKAQFEYVSTGIEQVLGYKQEEANLEFFFDKIHPEDLLLYINYEHELGRFLAGLAPEKKYQYKVRMDFRIRKKDGNYARILHQAMMLELGEDGNLLRSIGVHTDVSYLKMDGKPSLSFIGLDGEPSYVDVQVGEELIPLKEILSKREKEVLVHIMNGMQNREIAELLEISKGTVDKHRKNMLEKTGCKNSGELISRAIRNGWL